MKISLFDADDLKAIEDMLVKVLVRSARIIAKENLVQGWKPPVEAPPPRVPAPVVVETVKAPEPPKVVAPEPEIPAKKQRAPRRNVAKIVKTVADRPEGYITTDQARDLIGRDAGSQSALSRWILEQEIPAVIVAGHRPPTKGLPGRLMIDKKALLARNEQRKENVETMPSLARWKKDKQRKAA